MANKQIKDFDEITSPKNEDVVLIQQDGDDVTKKVKTENVMGELNAQQLRGGASSVLISGCDITINGGDPTKIDISAGELLFQDNTNPDFPTIQRLSYPGASGLSITEPASVVNIKIDNTGTVEFVAGSSWATVLTDLDRKVVIGVAQKAAGAGATVFAVNSATTTFMGPIMRTLCELALIVGIKSIQGNDLSPLGGLTVQKEAGKLFQIGSNFKNDPNNPNIIDTPLLNGAGADMFHVYRDGAGSIIIEPPTKDLEVGKLDDGSGTLTTYSSGQFAAYRFYINSANNLFVAYPQFAYSSINDAVAALDAEAYDEPNDAQTAYFLGVCIAKGNATDLTNASQAFFICYCP